MQCTSILILEDDDDIRTGLRELLRSEGYRVFAADSGVAGLTALREIVGPCLVFLDLLMPGMNGWEFVSEQLRRDSDTPWKVVVTSSLKAEAIWQTSEFTHSVVAYLRKPFDVDHVLEIVDQYCARPVRIPTTDPKERAGPALEALPE